MMELRWANEWEKVRWVDKKQGEELEQGGERARAEALEYGGHRATRQTRRLIEITIEIGLEIWDKIRDGNRGLGQQWRWMWWSWDGEWQVDWCIVNCPAQITDLRCYLRRRQVDEFICRNSARRDRTKNFSLNFRFTIVGLWKYR